MSVALSGHYSRVRECPLLEEKQSFRKLRRTGQFYEYTPYVRDPGLAVS